MFKQRALTALTLVPLVLFAIYFAPFSVLVGIVFVLVMGCGFEWLQLIPIRKRVYQFLFLLAQALSVILVYFAMPWFLIPGMLAWGVIIPLVMTYPQSEKIWGYPLMVGMSSFLLLPLFAVTFLLLYQQEQGADLIVYLLALVWATDIGAYLAGKLWGTHKLIPQVSPGKTQEGATGGIVAALVVAWVGYLYFNPYSLIAWFVIALVTILVSMFGDLFMSMLKRRSQVKDTGNIFPGHGGVLDRLDSLIAASPILYFGLSYFPPGL